VSVATPASHKKHTRVASVGKSKKELAKPKKAKPSNVKLTKPSPNGKTPVKAKKAKPSTINKKTPKTKEPKKTWHILNNGV
jgi:hypothetical protein